MDVRRIVDNLNWNEITYGRTYHRELLAKHLIENVVPTIDLQNLRLEECSDEYTGNRYGRASCRAGKCMKIGGGGRNKGNRYAYQIWLVWA
ncbi:MAG: hypothetical protein ACTSYH_03375 [Candidatus Heimdallarchaeaceae archaeon]